MTSSDDRAVKLTDFVNRQHARDDDPINATCCATTSVFWLNGDFRGCLER